MKTIIFDRNLHVTIEQQLHRCNGNYFENLQPSSEYPPESVYMTRQDKHLNCKLIEQLKKE
jgi:hypothetical protein